MAETFLHILLGLLLCVTLQGISCNSTGAFLEEQGSFPVNAAAHSTAWARRLVECLDDWHAALLEGTEEVEAEREKASTSPDQPTRSRPGQPVAARSLRAGVRLHSAFEVWEDAKSQNAALSWATRTCDSSKYLSTGFVRLDDRVKQQASCFAAAIGTGRAYYCACEQGDHGACDKKNALLKIPVLAQFAEAAEVDTGTLLLTGSRSAWFCSPEAHFGALGPKLLTPDIDVVLQRAAPDVAERWSLSMMKQLAQGSPDAANREVANLDTTEVQLLAAGLVEAFSGSSPMGGLRPSLLGGLAGEGRLLLEQAAATAGVSMACMDARRHCSKDVQCQKLVDILMPASGNLAADVFLSEALGNCEGRAALLGVLEVSAECPGALQRSARNTGADLAKIADFCAHNKEVEQSITSKLLPTLLAPVPFEMLPLACVKAYDECNRDDQCRKSMASQKGMSSEQMLSETVKLCASRETMLRAVDVIADCPGALPGASARVTAESLRSDLAGVPGHRTCNETTRLLSSVQSLVKERNTTKEVSLQCIKAHQRCGAESKCGPAVEAMVKQSTSKERMLAEALKLCSSRSAMLLALEVSYECPGMLPAKEARESHDALALVPEGQLCKKMQELTQVLTVLLSPGTSADCKAARTDCHGSAECGATWKRLEQHGDGARNLTMLEIVKLCHDKHAMLTALRMVMECEDHFPRDVLRNAYYALEPVSEQELCSETQLLLGRLGPQALKTLTLSMSSTVAPISCTSAHQRCGASLRCGPAVIAMETRGSMSPSEQVTDMLKLCDSKMDFFAVLGVAAECPSHPLSQEMHGLRQLLQDVPEARLCTEAVKYASDTLLPLAPPAVPSAACSQAHKECSEEVTCKSAVQDLGRGSHLQIFVKLCNSQQTFLSAMRVAVECPGPQLGEELRSALAVFRETPPEDLCQQANALLDSNSSLSAAILHVASMTAAHKALPGIALRLASRTIEAFDFTPKDGKLNIVEMEALVTQANTAARQSSSGAAKSSSHEAEVSKVATRVGGDISDDGNLQAFLKNLNLQAVHGAGSELVEASELASKLKPGLRTVLERLALSARS